MGLKRRIQAWLGVDELKGAFAKVEARSIDRQRMREEIADALIVVFSGEQNHRNYSLWWNYLEDHGGRFEKTLRKITGEQAEGAARGIVEARIGGEAFIDELVARVRRKQLDA